MYAILFETGDTQDFFNLENHVTINVSCKKREKNNLIGIYSVDQTIQMTIIIKHIKSPDLMLSSKHYFA
jgi:hypothetical protein